MDDASPGRPPKRRFARWVGASLALLVAGSTGALASCARPASQVVVDATMSSAHRAYARPYRLIAQQNGSVRPAPSKYQLLGGDMHCHISPPDHPPHVTRGAAETVELARDEGLDFVVLTPHIGSRFFQNEEYRSHVVSALAQLKSDIAAASPGNILFIMGMEYTDYQFGHVGVGFVDIEGLLAAVPAAEAKRRPERFFEEAVARGGVLTVNHPLVTPLDSIFSMAREDLSWRPFTQSGPFPPEIMAVNRLAQGFEAYNLTTTHLRDRYLVGDTEHSLRATLLRLDEEIVAQKRRMSPVGGSDSHSAHLRATTFVLAESRTEAGIRDAVVGGRICVRDPAACTFEARIPGGQWMTVGSSIPSAEAVDVRAEGEDIDIIVNGQSRETLGATGERRIDLNPDRCSVLRARVGEGYSAPIYANCPFAGGTP